MENLDLAALPARTAQCRGPLDIAALHVSWARCLADVRAAQRLRYRVFVEEGGAQVDGALRQHELDHFDPWCEHLLVRDSADGEVIGTYRVLTPEKALLQGGLYADAEFDLAPLWRLRPRLVEVGRACVHPDHRAGGVILALWRALARFMVARGLDTMIGSASVPMRDGGHVAADGTGSEVVSAYLDTGAGSSAERTWPSAEEAPGDDRVRMTAVRPCAPSRGRTRR